MADFRAEDGAHQTAVHCPMLRIRLEQLQLLSVDSTLLKLSRPDLRKDAWERIDAHPFQAVDGHRGIGDHGKERPALRESSTVGSRGDFIPRQRRLPLPARPSGSGFGGRGPGGHSSCATGLCVFLRRGALRSAVVGLHRKIPLEGLHARQIRVCDRALRCFSSYRAMLPAIQKKISNHPGTCTPANPSPLSILHWKSARYRQWLNVLETNLLQS